MVFRLETSASDLNGGTLRYHSNQDMTRHEDRVLHADTRSTSIHSTLPLAPIEHIPRCTSPSTASQVAAMCRILRLQYECGHDSPNGTAPCAGRNYGGCKGQRIQDVRRPEECPSCGEWALQPKRCIRESRSLD